MRFGYLRDRVFLFCVVVYILSWVLRHVGVHGWLLDGYLNDLLCVGFWVPIMLMGMRRVGWRRHDGMPTAGEVLMAVAVWSWMYEWWLPRVWDWPTPMVADPFDVTAYAVGGFLAMLAWRWRYERAV